MIICEGSPDCVSDPVTVCCSLKFCREHLSKHRQTGVHSETPKQCSQCASWACTGHGNAQAPEPYSEGFREGHRRGYAQGFEQGFADGRSSK